MHTCMEGSNMAKNVLLLFAKLPEPGMAKTRLSVLKDGVFSPEDAADLFGCMLLDVIEICLSAFERLGEHDRAWSDSQRGMQGSYELVISTAPAKNATAMREFIEAEFGPVLSCAAEGETLDEAEDATAGKLLYDSKTAALPIRVISDSGASFDEHYNDAFAQVWEQGAASILSMGADMPALTSDDIVRGFRALHDLAAQGRKGIVFAPDQEMGASMVGWNRETDFDHSGVYYNPTGLTVLPAYIDKAREAGLDAVWLPPVPDVDTMADLAHNLTLMDALSYCSERNEDFGSWAHRTYAMLEDLGAAMVRIPPNELRDPRDVIDA